MSTEAVSETQFFDAEDNLNEEENAISAIARVLSYGSGKVEDPAEAADTAVSTGGGDFPGTEGGGGETEAGGEETGGGEEAANEDKADPESKKEAE